MWRSGSTHPFRYGVAFAYERARDGGRGPAYDIAQARLGEPPQDLDGQVEDDPTIDQARHVSEKPDPAPFFHLPALGNSDSAESTDSPWSRDTGEEDGSVRAEPEEELESPSLGRTGPASNRGVQEAEQGREPSPPGTSNRA